MGNFHDHMRYGVGSYILFLIFLTGGVFYLGYYANTITLDRSVVSLTVISGIIALPLTIGGATFPDIDHHASKPHKWLRTGVFVSATLMSSYLFISEGNFYSLTLAESLKTASGAPLSDEVLSLIIIGIGALIVGVVAEHAVSFFRPAHRGITHTLTTGGVVSAIIGGIVALGLLPFFPDVSLLLGTVAGTSFFMGFVSHLQCDGLLFKYLPEC